MGYRYHRYHSPSSSPSSGASSQMKDSARLLADVSQSTLFSYYHRPISQLIDFLSGLELFTLPTKSYKF